MKKDTHGYKGWLNSDVFLKRVAAVTFYGMLGELLITLAVLIVMAIVVVIGDLILSI